MLLLALLVKCSRRPVWPQVASRRAAVMAVVAAMAALAGGGAGAAGLPVAGGGGTCVGGVCLSAGQASAVASLTRIDITQTTPKAIFNWSEFNIAAGNTVNFKQPDVNSLAINKIFQSSPSQIFGSLTANGQVYLINQNGILFGRGSQVNVGSLVASSLPLDPVAEAEGILSSKLLRTGKAAFAADGRTFVLDENGQQVLDAAGHPIPVRVAVEEGASLTSDPKGGGRLMLLGQEVSNAGDLQSNQGQVILAAGQKVYVEASSDPTLRGLLVEVDTGSPAWNQLTQGGRVSNEATGSVSTPQGNISLVGLAVNQSGRLSATTSVRANGSVRLLAGDTVKITSTANEVDIAASRGGTVTLGAGSVVEVRPDATDTQTAVNDQAQPLSFVEVAGRRITMASASSITATGGSVSLTAAADPTIPRATASPLPVDPDAQVRLESGSRIDVSGADATASVERNMVDVELRANELRDAPVQRDGPLRGKTVTVDARVGTPLADVSGAVAAIKRGVNERLSKGGTVTLESQGDVAMADGSLIDVSGGQVTYTPGVIATAQLVTADGRWVDIGSADPGRLYTAVVQPRVTVKDPKWGVTEKVVLNGFGRFDQGYVEGKDAGTVQFAAPALAVNGALKGDVVAGLYQRSAAAQPLGGRLVIGLADGQGSKVNDFKAPSVTLTPSVVPLDLLPGTPLTADVLRLPTRYLSEGGFTRTEIYSNGVVSVDDALDLAPGSVLTLQGDVVRDAADIHASGGRLTFRAVDVNAAVRPATDGRTGVYVADGVHLDVRGDWVNDSQTSPTPDLTRPLYLDGGQVNLLVTSLNNAELSVGRAVTVNADGGARMTPGGSIAAGTGGQIAIQALGPDAVLATGDGLQLSALALSKGGSLTLGANQLEVVAGEPFVVPRLGDPTATEPTPFRVGDGLFQTGGFSSYQLIATGGTLAAGTTSATGPLTITAGSRVAPRMDVLALAPGYALTGSGAALADIADTVTPPDYQRTAANVSFAIQPRSGNLANPAAALVLEAGAEVATDPGGTVSFASPTPIRLEGSVTAPGGTIVAHEVTPSGAFDQGYDPAAGIFIGSHAQLSAAGVTVLQPGDVGLRQGTVRDGGAIQLLADRGTVNLAAGSSLDVSGTAATIDLFDGNAYQATRVASAGGSIVLLAPEGLTLAGELRGAAGDAAGGFQPVGGSLSIGVSRLRGFAPPAEVLHPFPATPRQILLGGVTPAGGEATGTVWLDPVALVGDGFGSLTLQADDRIEFQGDVSLRLPSALNLQAPTLAAAAGVNHVSLVANTLELGPRLRTGPAPAAASSGGATLAATARLIDLSGRLALQGFSATTLSSATDIRLTGLPAINGQGPLAGSLDAAGTLTLASQRLYPTTFTDYRITVAPDAAGRLDIGPAAGGLSSQVPLSAGGSLSLEAADILQAGAVFAPLGELQLTARNTLTLPPGSITSSSSGGQTIPFGQVQGGSEWDYEAAPNVFTEIVAPRGKRVRLQGDAVTVAAGATVDVSGGGDLYAYEFVPGPGGSTDKLSPLQSPTLFALLPGRGEQFASFDTQEYANSSLHPGDSVHLEGVAGLLPAGDYALLPARYALLPGAVLVQVVANTRDLAVGTGANLPDGTPIVSGYREVAGTGLRDARSVGFAVRPGSYARQLAEYDDSFGTPFFSAQAARNDAVAPLLARDAGALQLQVGDSLSLLGSVTAAAGTGGRGARVDVSANDLRIVGAAPDGTPSVVSVSADALNGLGAESILLGGTRATSADVTTITPVANDVTIAGGARLAAPELILTATDRVTLESGAEVAATGTAGGAAAQPRLAIATTSGAGLLRASRFGQVEVTRADGAAATGDVVLEADARVSAPGSITVSAGGTARSEGFFDVAGGSLSLGSTRIAFGADPATVTNALVLSDAQLAAIPLLSELRLVAGRDISFQSAVDVGAGAGLKVLALDAPNLVGGGADVRLRADRIELTNTGATGAAPGTGAGLLQLDAREVSFGDGVVGVGGFGATQVSASSGVRTTGDFALASAGAVTVSTPRLSGAAGSTLHVAADGYDVTLSGAGTAAPGRGDVGAALEVTGRDIVADTALLFPAGNVRLAAEQDLQLGAHGLIDASAAEVPVGPVLVDVPGGAVTLVARAGDVVALAGSRVDVSATQASADAGRLGIYAGGTASLAGTLQGGAGANRRGGSVDLYAGSVPDFGTLADAFAAGQFTARQAIELGQGSIDVNAGRMLRAADVQLAADRGAISVLGTVDARADGGGSIVLAARDGVQVGAGARLEAGNTGSGSRGGRVDLESLAQPIAIDGAATIDVSGGAVRDAGTVRLAAPVAGGGVAITSIGGRVNCDGAAGCSGAINGAGNVEIAPVVAATAGPVLDAAAVGALKGGLDAYMAGAPAQIRSDLQIDAAAPVHIRPELRVTSSGDLTVTDPIDLSSWRYDTGGDQPGTLTLRATGSLTLQGTLSDGVSGSGSGLAALAGPSWSYALVSGADASSALPGATAGHQLDPREAGDLTIAPGVIVRTGTGSIRLAADRDVFLADGNAAIYTTGVAARSPVKVGVGPLAATANWLTGGGDVELLAGRDVVAVAPTQIESGWDVRGTRGGTLWATDLSKFRQGVAALGGGDIVLRAGRDVVNLSATVPTSGQQQGAGGAITTWGGGNLRVDAGRDVLSGVFSAWQGNAAVSAGRDIALGNTVSGFDVHVIAAPGAGTTRLTARRNLQFETTVNPTTVAPVGSATDKPYFFTEGAQDELDLVAIGGNVTWFNDPNAFGAVVGSSVGAATPALGVTPATVRVLAPAGDVNLLRGMTLLPSPTGNLDILAGGSVIADTGAGITMSDVLPSSVPSASTPLSQNSVVAAVSAAAQSAIHVGDAEPVRVVAGSGNVQGGIYDLAKHFEFSAARDIRALRIEGQNTDPTLVSLVEAGRDVRFESTTDEISVAGPGRLQVLAGRNLDLGFGAGLVTIGNTRNAQLPSSTGANLDVWVGLGTAGPAYDAFVTTYLQNGTDYQASLVAYMKGLGAPADVTPEQALAQFRALPLAEQRPLISNIFFNELRESGREANRDATLGFSRGLAAIGVLFPEASTFRGDLAMVFSRIYTLAGGDINLLIPGGLLNVGLAKQPQNLSVQRKPSDLGIVAQGAGAVRVFADGDVLVNQSRIFTLQGGDIVIWSSEGNIDAGRGAKSAVSAPPPVITVDENGQIQVQFSDAIAGSGIRGILTRSDIEPGDVDLIAPKGEVNAGDAGIGSAGNLNIAAPQVVGLDNIQVGGVSSGVPTEASLAAGLTGVSSLAAAANESASNAASAAGGDKAPLADAATGWLEVFVEGFGDKDDEDKDKEKKKRDGPGT